MTNPFDPNPDRSPKGIDSDPPRRRGIMLATAAAVSIVAGIVLVALGLPWWLVVGFVVLVLAMLVVAT